MRTTSLAMVLSGCFFAGWVASGWAARVPDRITFLQVGQGDCALVQTSGWSVLVDAAPKTDTFDAGERLAFPELRRLGVRTLDIVILTHPDIDHYGGIQALSGHLPIGRILVSEAFERYPTLLARIGRIAPTSVVRRDCVMTLGSTHFELLASTSENDNDSSLAVGLHASGLSAVLTGDLTREGERSLLPRLGWSAYVLKAGHHGSASSTSTEWLGKMRPRWVIVSCGRWNPYSHPSKATLARIKRSGSQLLRTDRDGSITFEFQPKGWVLR